MDVSVATNAVALNGEGFDRAGVVSTLAFRRRWRLFRGVTPTILPAITRPAIGLGLSLVLAFVGTPDSSAAAATTAEPEEEKPTSTLLQVLTAGKLKEPSRRILDQEQPVSSGARLEVPVYSIYFPPHPPPLGVDVSLGDIDTRVGAPMELAPHVMELFYAPLSTHVIERSLSRSQRAALLTYEEKKAALLSALRQRLDEVATIDTTSRRVALEAFAVVQAPELAALEQEAERLRTTLISPSHDWYALRGWKLGRGRLDGPREQTLFLEYQLLRAAAFYQEGPSPEQRRLLRECAIELEARVFPGSLSEDPAAAEWFWFFSPHLARLHLPDDLPADIQQLIAAYRESKTEVKQELRDAVYAADEARFASAREAPLRALAAAQAERLRALEQDAELIRRRLALTAPPPVPAAPAALPSELAALIEDYRQRKRALEVELIDRLRRTVRHLVVPDRYATGPTKSDWRQARAAAVADARQSFGRENAARITTLRERHEAVRTAIATWHAATGTEPVRPTGTGSFLTDFFVSREQQQGRHDYHLAVLEPGLSPEQRRLLFGAAVVAMNLPLPGPENQPTSLPGTLLK